MTYGTLKGSAPKRLMNSVQGLNDSELVEFCNLLGEYISGRAGDIALQAAAEAGTPAMGRKMIEFLAKLAGLR